MIERKYPVIEAWVEDYKKQWTPVEAIDYTEGTFTIYFEEEEKTYEFELEEYDLRVSKEVVSRYSEEL